MTNVTIARYLLGFGLLVISLASLGIASFVLRQRYVSGWEGALARLAEVVIALVLLTLQLELVGLFGGLRIVPITVISVAVGVVSAWSGGWRPPRSTRRGQSPDGSWTLTWIPTAAVALLAVGAVAVEWAIPTLQAYDYGIRSFDSLWYHLPWAASFAQTGHITPLRFTDVEYLTPFYPATAELFHALGIVFLARDTLSPALNFIWLGLALLAAYCIGRPQGVGTATLTGAALAMATPMMRFSQPGSAANDVVGIFFLLAAVAFLVNAEGRRAAVALAGAAAGLAIGVKLSMVAPALALTVGSFFVGAAGRRSRNALAWLVPLVAVGGFWYARNLIAVGNPLPWLNVPGLAHPAPGLQQHTAFTVAHYLFNTHVLSIVFKPGLAAGLGRWWVALAAVALLGPLLCLLPGAGRVTRMLGVVALVSIAAYVLTPESAAGPAGMPLGFAFNLRYAAPALTLCFAITPLAPVLRGRRVLIPLLAFLVLIVSVLVESRLWPGAYLDKAFVLVAIVIAAVLALRWRPLVIVPLVVLAAVGGGYPVQRHYLRVRYVYQPGISSLARVWSLFRRVHDARVGVVGTFGGFFSYPLFGVDDSNRVEYVARRGPNGSFTPIHTCQGWRATVNAGRYRYLVTTPARDPWHPNVLSFSPEGEWTLGDRSARVIYRQSAVKQIIRVFALRGPLDPAACPGAGRRRRAAG